jgi:(R,R)-butanediol dehydrogenase/meso-butanediol dehydrogenase/diacetyl reductase
MAAVAICLSEKHSFEGYWPRLSAPGSVMGHEGSAVVAAVGDGVTSHQVGDRVVVDVLAGYPLGVKISGARGLMADYVTLPWQLCTHIPPSVTDIAGSCVEPFAPGTRAVRHSNIAIGDNVVFFGLDDYSLSALQWVRRSPVNRLVVVEAIENRRKLAARHGAETVDANADDVAGLLHDYAPFGFDVAFVSAEMYIERSLRYLGEAVSAVRPQGTVVIIRIYESKPLASIDALELWKKELVLRSFGKFWQAEAWRGGEDRGDWQLTIDSIASGVLDADSHVTPFDWRTLHTPEDIRGIIAAVPHDIYKASIVFPADRGADAQ